MTDINLLPSEDKVSEKLSSLQKKLTVFSIVVLGAVSVFTITTLVMLTAAKDKEKELKARVRVATDEVTSQQLTEELLTVVDKKVETASKARASRIIYTNVLRRTAELMPTGVFFSDLRIDGLKLSSGSTAKSSSDVANLVSSFVTTDEGKKLFTSMSVDSLATTVDGEYAFSVSMQVNPAPSCSLIPQKPNVSPGQSVLVSSNNSLAGEIRISGEQLGGETHTTLNSKLVANEIIGVNIPSGLQDGAYDISVVSEGSDSGANICGSLNVAAASAVLPEGTDN